MTDGRFDLSLSVIAVIAAALDGRGGSV